MPIFPCWNSYTAAMIGDHCSSVIADAYVKEIRDFDVEKAYEGLRKNAFTSTDKFEDYENHAFGTAFFIDIQNEDEQKRIVRHGFTEEVNELLTDESGSATMQLLRGALQDGEEKVVLQEAQRTRCRLQMGVQKIHAF